jgi:hypothetical protein
MANLVSAFRPASVIKALKSNGLRRLTYRITRNLLITYILVFYYSNGFSFEFDKDIFGFPMYETAQKVGIELMIQKKYPLGNGQYQIWLHRPLLTVRKQIL